jgi:hypothetical protein
VAGVVGASAAGSSSVRGGGGIVNTLSAMSISGVNHSCAVATRHRIISESACAASLRPRTQTLPGFNPQGRYPDKASGAPALFQVAFSISRLASSPAPLTVCSRLLLTSSCFCLRVCLYR